MTITMMTTLLRTGWLNFKRDRVALGLTFVLPIIFFSIFAMIFGGMSTGGSSGGGSSAGMKVIVVDEDQTELSQRFAESIDEQEGLRVYFTPIPTEENPEPSPSTRETARGTVRAGNVAAAIIIPEGFSDTFAMFGGEQKSVDVYYDSANPMAAPTVNGLLQSAAMTAAPDVLMERGLDSLSTFGGGLTPQQQTAVNLIRPFLRGEKPWNEFDETNGEEDSNGSDESDSSPTSGITGLVAVNSIPARSDDDSDEPPNIVAYYAAGIGVMFLLFSMAGAGGSILEEEERGTLERLLTSNVSMGTLLMSNWIFFALIGIAQVALMFVWGALIFDLELFTAHNFVGFAAMTICTGTAAAAFGIMLATICRSRAQLSGISTIVILIMSALGGSMVPRFIMPAFMNTTAKFTFNGWALDGYLDVFWYAVPGESVTTLLARIAPELGVLAVMAVAFLVIARLVARRWETV